MPDIRLFWPPASCEAETPKDSIKTKTESGKYFCIRVVLSIKVRLIVMSTNFVYWERERQRKRENMATGQQSSTGKRGWAREEKQMRHFFWRDNTKFCSGGEKMRNARGHKGENKRQWKRERVNNDTYDISSVKRVTRKFLEVSRRSRAKQRQRNARARAKLFFC